MNAPPLKRLASSAALAALTLLPALAQAQTQNKEDYSPLFEDKYVDLREIIARSGGVIEVSVCHVEVKHTMYDRDNKPYPVDHTAFTLCDVEPIWGKLEDKDQELIVYSMITKPGTGIGGEIYIRRGTRFLLVLSRPGVRVRQVLHPSHARVFWMDGNYVRFFGYLSDISPSGHARFSYKGNKLNRENFINMFKAVSSALKEHEPTIVMPQFAQINPDKEGEFIFPYINNNAMKK